MEQKHQTAFRLPVSLKKKLEQEARENHRTLVSIIIEMLVKRYKNR